MVKNSQLSSVTNDTTHIQATEKWYEQEKKTSKKLRFPRRHKNRRKKIARLYLYNVQYSSFPLSNGNCRFAIFGWSGI